MRKYWKAEISIHNKGVSMKIGIIILLIILSINLEANYTYEEIDGEYRIYCNEHHFMSLLNNAGECAFRPHPGDDINGWGSTIYLQPFLPGAVLMHTVIDDISTNFDGVNIICSGLVSFGQGGNWGCWDFDLFFSYADIDKIVSGSGDYHIHLSDALSEESGDLNLYKIASNYLYNVPLLDPPFWGDTGDMSYTEVLGNAAGFPFFWYPADNPGYFPGYFTDSLAVYVYGEYNNIDTVAQGYEYIAPAWKPSISVTLNSEDNAEITFGGIYDLDHSSEFWSDNIGITPIILSNSDMTDFDFSVIFNSDTDEPIVMTEEKLIKDSHDFIIYPNPLMLSRRIRGNINIRLYPSWQNNEAVKLIVYNIKGQKIKEMDFTIPVNRSIPIKCDLFKQTGIYILQLQSKNFITSRKIVVVK